MHAEVRVDKTRWGNVSAATLAGLTGYTQVARRTAFVSSAYGPRTKKTRCAADRTSVVQQRDAGFRNVARQGGSMRLSRLHVAAAAALLLVVAPDLYAATFAVDTTSDEPAKTACDAVVTDDCSLRGAHCRQRAR